MPKTLRTIVLVVPFLLCAVELKTDLTKEEQLDIVAMNQGEMDAFVKEQEARMKYQAAIANSKAIIEKMKALHGSQGCDLNRSTMRWENCKTPIEKKK